MVPRGPRGTRLLHQPREPLLDPAVQRLLQEEEMETREREDSRAWWMEMALPASPQDP